ncbi:MAG TPA: tetratricopeptide repeat protein [Spirochaetota bacterium]|nr:tetratricopeptide repeat protein [Spirochaetota bacterium]HPC39419.1 tetratricopeptide repeat protein [Spirochaetota bacterium]HPL17303.1 tetratricopeptide repeat protein [Spirochaetota bacterium]HQF06756.1 tetratricopeptide repeat protein [Spirochaetota bacterium]HQH95625.1 tetratricopeptide repeat protein [Spirochaetota bacterium]
MKKTLVMTALLLFAGTSLYASYKEALKLFEQKDYKGSLKMIADELETANDTKPDSPNYNLRFLAAHNHWKLGNTKSAIDHFTRCIAIKKNKVDPYIDLALLQIEIKKYAEADATAKKGMEVEKSPMLYYIMGMTSLKRENFWKAKEMFEKANSLNPDLYYSYNALGVTLMKLKKYGEANTAFSAAYAVKPRSVEIVNNLGMSYEKLGKVKDAYEYYKKALALDEKNRVIATNIDRVKGKVKN